MSGEKSGRKIHSFIFVLFEFCTVGMKYLFRTNCTFKTMKYGLAIFSFPHQSSSLPFINCLQSIPWWRHALIYRAAYKGGRFGISQSKLHSFDDLVNKYESSTEPHDSCQKALESKAGKNSCLPSSGERETG